jgi:predicted RNA-binding Zn-ribbon protein involved in translation (DUF1610 family)
MPKGRVWPITVFVCPNCGNYYGASSAGDLGQKIVTAKNNRVSMPRDRCPDCGDKRVPCIFSVELVPKEKVGREVDDQEAIGAGGE